MIEMSHTEEDLKGSDLFANEEEKQPVNDVAQKCNTALEILQNELINCERNISLEKSVREQNERKFECVGESKEIESEVTADDILHGKSINYDKSIASDIFSNDQYCELIENILRVGNHFNGIEEDDVQKIIFEYAELNKISHGFDETLRRTGNEWCQRFIRLYPQLNSVMKKGSKKCIQLDETDTTFSNRIVDKFLSDYKNNEEDGAKTEESIKRSEMEKEKYFDVVSDNEQISKFDASFSYQKGEQDYLNNSEVFASSCVVDDTETLKQNKLSNFPDEKNVATIEAVIENAAEPALDSKQAFSSTLAENLSFNCFADTPDCVENCKNEEFFRAVSSPCSNNIRSVDKCSTKENHFGNDENNSNESIEKLNITFENIAEIKNYSGCGVNSTSDVLPIRTCDSSEIPVEEAFVSAENDHALVEKANILTEDDSSFGKALDIVSTKVTESCTKLNDDDITIAVDCVNDDSTDMRNLSDNYIIFSENPSRLSNLKTKQLEENVLDNLEKTKSAEENSSSVNDDSTFCNKCHETGTNNPADFSVDNDIVTGEKSSDETTCMNILQPSVRSASKRKETDVSTNLENESDEKKPKMSKKKRPSSKKKTKKSKYLYKLKSYTGSVLYFTSSTSVSFIKPVIKLTKLDETSCKNSDSIITSPPNATAPTEANRIDEDESYTNASSGSKDQVVAESNSSADFKLEDKIVAETNSRAGYELKDQVVAETNSSAGLELKDQVVAETNSSAGSNIKDRVDVETDFILDNDLRDQDKAEVSLSSGNDIRDTIETETNFSPGNDLNVRVEEKTNLSPGNDLNVRVEEKTNLSPGSDLEGTVEAETNSSPGNDLEEQVDAEMNSSPGNDVTDQVGAATNPSPGNDVTDQVGAATNPSPRNDVTDQVESVTNPSPGNDLTEQVELAANPSPGDDSKDPVEAKTNSSTDNQLKDEITDDTNFNAGSDLKDVAKPPKTSADKSVNGPTSHKGATPTLKMNTSNESITPTFGMQTRRKRLKFLPDGTLVTPNQRHQLFSNDFTSSRSESRNAKKRSLKTSSQDSPRSEKKIKTVSTPPSGTLKQSSRSAESTVSTKKISRNRPDRYIPKPNGQSKKPQKIFDYDSYYRENFRQTEVKLPPSCKKQMVALSRVTSISPGAQSDGQITVNPAQLLSCLLGMPITPDQIRTVRFKPPGKQLKPNKQVNITPSKLASNDAIKPITKRHLELLQKTTFNIVPKTEIGVAKSTANTKSQPATH